MDFDAPKRFDRIVAILIQLQSKKTVKAKELAERFQVSLRTIYRDIRSLETAGIPLYGEAGTGYSLVEGYRLPPVMFTREEAGSFVAAEKLMKHFTDKNLGDHFESAVFKIKSVLRNSEKDWVEALGQHISIHSAQKAFNEKIPNALELLFESLAQKKQVVLNYQSLQREKPVVRNIEPVGLFHENRYWYILGYCHLRKDYRQFRIDRIKNISRSDKAFVHEHGTVEEHRKQKEDAKKVKVKLLVDKKAVRYMKYDRESFGFVSEKNIGLEKVEMTFEARDISMGFPRWFLMYADFAQILEPESLKTRVREILSNANKKIEE